MKFLKKILIFSSYMIIYTNLFSFNIGIAPTGFYTSLDKNQTHEIMVSNNTLEPMRVEIDVEKSKGWENYSMEDLIKIYPKSLTLKPNASRSVRFAVRGTKDLSDGEYKAKLIFREVSNKSKIIEKDIKGETGEEVAFDFELLTEIQIDAYGLKGTRKIEASLLNSILKKDSNGNIFVVADFKLKGNSGIAVIGDFEYLDSGRKRIAKEEIKIGITARNSNPKIETNLANIPKNTKYIRVQYRDKSGLKLGTKELTL